MDIEQIRERIKEINQSVSGTDSAPPLKVRKREAAIITLADPNACVSAKRQARAYLKTFNKRNCARGCYHYMRRRKQGKDRQWKFYYSHLAKKAYIKFLEVRKGQDVRITEEEMVSIHAQVMALKDRPKKYFYEKKNSDLPWTVENLCLVTKWMQEVTGVLIESFTRGVSSNDLEIGR